MAEKEYEPQTKTVEADIPDVELKKPEPITLPPKVKAERDIRRYIHKDGLFIKDLERMWDRETGKRDALGNMKRVKTKTKEEAEKIVIELCEKAGRKIEKDLTTGRLKAVPGWDLTIRVPGMLREEQMAPKPPEGEERQKINEKLLLSVQEENKELKASLAKIQARLDNTKPSGQGKSTKKSPKKAKK